MVKPGSQQEPSVPVGAAVILAMLVCIVCAVGGFFAGLSSRNADYDQLKANADAYAKEMKNHGRDEFNRGYESGKMFQVADIVHAKAAEYQLDKTTGKPRLVYKYAQSACSCVSCDCK